MAWLRHSQAKGRARDETSTRVFHLSNSVFPKSSFVQCQTRSRRAHKSCLVVLMMGITVGFTFLLLPSKEGFHVVNTSDHSDRVERDCVGTFISVLCCPVLSCAVLCCPVLSCAVLCCPVLSCAVLCVCVCGVCVCVSVVCLSVCRVSVCLSGVCWVPLELWLCRVVTFNVVSPLLQACTC